MTPPVVELDRHRARGPRRRLRVIIGIFVALALLALAWMIWFSSLLTADSVTVVGVDGAAAREVHNTASVPLGVPLAQLDTDAIAQHLSTIGWIDHIDVRRGWPHEVVIAVTPRTAIATRSDGTVVDAAGVAFTPVAVVPSGLPIVHAEDLGLVAAMGVLTSLPDDIRQKVVSLKATTRDDVALTLKSSAIVRWGSIEQAELKAQVTRALLKRKATIYDVSAPELPTTFKEKLRR
ncbi:MAG: FtsQ-type POTRA domain-containing protein, partial [Actinomycetota bacterium]|nr:FtsQ-type POTRA domain-containing protein [Actinomycetota bacterium]MDP2288994.1 FtsQ-type POTRA domain-containing protein [Actinomycetota bacterium]